jgi:hypothetical protein
LEEALAHVPTTLEDGKPHPFNGDVEIQEVKVVDGTTGEKVAWGSALWSTGYGRGSGYKYTGWMGYRPDTGAFNAVYSGRTKIDKTWDEAIQGLREEQARKDHEKALADLEDAKRRLAASS